MRKFAPIGGGDTDLKERTTELRKAAKILAKQAQEIVGTAPIVDGPVDPETKQAVKVVDIDRERKTRFDEIMGQLKPIQEQLRANEELQKVMEWGETPQSQPGAVEDNARLHLVQGAQGKSLGQLFVESDPFLAMKQRGGLTMDMPFELSGDQYRAMFKDVYTTLPSGTPSQFGTVVRDPLVPRPQLRMRVRDLFPQRPTSANMIEYFRVTGFANGASTVAERDGSNFALKPQSGLSFEGQQAPVRTIAHWEAAHRSVLADEPQLQGLIDTELLYGLALREDQQILTGTGQGEDLLGILNVTGIQEITQGDDPPGLADDKRADVIRRAATLAYLALYEATGVVVHPSDWEDVELAKDSTGQYLAAIVVAVATGAEPRIWRMPVVETPSIDEGTALVGAFGLGAQLYDREEANIRVSEHHSDFFLRNAVAILAEKREALAVKRPESFVRITFTGDE